MFVFWYTVFIFFNTPFPISPYSFFWDNESRKSAPLFPSGLGLGWSWRVWQCLRDLHPQALSEHGTAWNGSHPCEGNALKKKNNSIRSHEKEKKKEKQPTRNSMTQSTHVWMVRWKPAVRQPTGLETQTQKCEWVTPVHRFCIDRTLC